VRSNVVWISFFFFFWRREVSRVLCRGYRSGKWWVHCGGAFSEEWSSARAAPPQITHLFSLQVLPSPPVHERLSKSWSGS